MRQAIVWTSASQFLNMAIGFSATLVMVRLLTPAEYGVCALGWAILAVAEAVRELASGAYLIRERELTTDKVQSTTTVNLLLTLVVVTSLLFLAAPLASFYMTPALTQFLWVAVIGYALGALLYPQQALMSRDLAFNWLSIVGFAMTAVGAFASIMLALMQFSSLSFAWAGVASMITGTLLCFGIRGDLTIYKPSIRQWRSVVGFGIYNGATAVLGKIGEAVPLLIFGKLLSAAEVAIGSRAVIICLFLERMIFGPVLAVALPEFSRQVRGGQDLKPAYLSALSHITAVHWPAMILLAMLAQPIVVLVLGHQWQDVIPLVRILSPALMFATPIGLQYAVLSAANGVHLLPHLLALQFIVLAAALAITAGYGLQAAALSMFVVMPLNAGISLLFVRSTIPFRWLELIAALARSITVTLITAVGPLALVLFAWTNGTPAVVVATGAAIGAAGWCLALYATAHPLGGELIRAAAGLTRVTPLRNLRST
jgi:O-antigen/teichoic acid export membrane protein